MLSEAKPKKAAFSIEFLARSSHDEKEDGGPKNYVSKDAVIQSTFRTDFSGSAFITPEKSPSSPLLMSSLSSTKTSYPLKLSLISPTNSAVKRKREDSCDSGVESPSPDRFRHISEASNSSNSSFNTSGIKMSKIIFFLNLSKWTLFYLQIGFIGHEFHNSSISFFFFKSVEV